jgi:hypothetical protein
MLLIWKNSVINVGQCCKWCQVSTSVTVFHDKEELHCLVISTRTMSNMPFIYNFNNKTTCNILPELISWSPGYLTKFIISYFDLWNV